MSEILEVSKTQSPKSYLFATIVKSHLGEIASIIVSILISCERLSAKDIARRTKLNIKIVKKALVSLIQLNCMFYWKDESSKDIFYSFNEEGVLNLLYSGEIIQTIKNLYGEPTAEIVQNLLLNGSVRIEDYLEGKDEEEKINKQNLLIRLVKDQWIVELRPINFSPINDLWNKWFKEISKNTPRLSTTSEVKRVNEIKEKTKKKLVDLLDSREGESPDARRDIYVLKNGYKLLRADLLVKFNFKRFQKHQRTNFLVGLCRSRIGLISSRIYQICLNLIESSSPDLEYELFKISNFIVEPLEKESFLSGMENKLVDDKKIVFSINDLKRLIPDDLDLKNSILPANGLNKRKMSEAEEDNKRVKLESGTTDDILAEALTLDGQDMLPTNFEAAFEGAPLFNFDPSTANQDESILVQHLKLLSSSTGIQFVIETTPGSYTVPFYALQKHIKTFNFESLVKTTIGNNGFRILRCLKTLKLGDEKSISNAVLLKEKTVRNELYKLFNLNMIEIQEVPRSNDRAASKTFYLFRHKEDFSYSFLRNSLMFTMGKILTNVENFKEDHKILLEKCEREDVKGKEEELLLDSELKVLRDLQVREVKSLARFNRIKAMVDVYSM
ncbi:DNA-directed RNA polymerase III subunit RPC3 [Suhomyces tanzawaensis NRRL Y-17324]|uniref:DNA-directed RNA polymerase III subunit RPC3 n=1 Tax=Suhomyces tanzawaensis NRRL Y-17324 TaxID=984487 RepID=A0A1E4SRJ3_9ASCO|nr:DNA-directed RNA polymerase III subunit RPC3 [Suhomyces tanzawaensis NRRL Y-17324]ODV82130.1 DNA-directed RNA polymerase III subunit RPC3 [Suhomyces tanzawaensis NRRL Y-17324]